MLYRDFTTTEDLDHDYNLPARVPEAPEIIARWAADTDDYLPSRRTPDEFDRDTGRPTPARIRPRPSKMDMFGRHGPY